ncbi:hypothetical protein [Streptomyces cinereospinus]|uniref:Uncharacterized protein n=1 Tax=Streptomyces cinereospinus TaxID=285561 RepID=A0ABV5MZ69_9ACTN
MSAPDPQATADPYARPPYEESPTDWWTPHEGVRDVRSGVVYFPPGSNPPRSPHCPLCQRKDGSN